jgi:hypothetical protein
LLLDKKALVRLTFEATASNPKAAGTYALGLKLPQGAIVTAAWYKVHTTFASATDAATIALQAEAADDVVAAVAVSDGSNPWDAAPRVNSLIDGAFANAVETTAERDVSAVVAAETLTAGKMDVWLELALPSTAVPKASL